MIRQRFTFTGAGEDFGPRADGLVTAHTTQSPYNRLTVADAIVLARWQDRADVAGSYNDLICIDGILECVPPSHASGGINPASKYFIPESWLYDVMSPEMVRNPNYFTRNVAFMGDMHWFDANGCTAPSIASTSRRSAPCATRSGPACGHTGRWSQARASYGVPGTRA